MQTSLALPFRASQAFLSDLYSASMRAFSAEASSLVMLAAWAAVRATLQPSRASHRPGLNVVMVHSFPCCLGGIALAWLRAVPCDMLATSRGRTQRTPPDDAVVLFLPQRPAYSSSSSISIDMTPSRSRLNQVTWGSAWCTVAPS